MTRSTIDAATIDAATIDDEAPVRQQPTKRRLDPALLLAPAMTALAVVPRLLTATAGNETVDESLWMARSAGFSDAVTSGDFGNASAMVAVFWDVATMPGVTTMWIGTLARGLWATGRDFGLWADPEASFASSDSGLIAAQSSMAVATSVLVGVLVFLVARWVGWRSAAVTGVLIATEPFLVAHGAIFHTDELLALFAIGALLATALVLGLPQETAWTGQRRAALVAGGLWGGALLTKLSALMFLPGAALLGTWGVIATLRRRDATSVWQAMRPLCRLGAWSLVAAVVVILVAYPALWVGPVTELRAMRESTSIVEAGSSQFFLGEATTRPGPAFYFVALPLRVTPWFLLGGVVALVGLLFGAARRRFGVALGCMGVPPLVVVSLARLKFERYGLFVLVLGAIAIGIVLVAMFDALQRRAPSGRAYRGLVILAGAFVVVHALTVTPWGLAYFNPVLGGGTTGERAILVGWGEGIAGTNDIIEAHWDGDCDDVTVWAFRAWPDITCGRVPAEDEVPTYVAIYVSERQALPVAGRADLVADRDLVGEVKVRGITYVEVFGPTSAPLNQSTADRDPVAQQGS